MGTVPVIDCSALFNGSDIQSSEYLQARLEIHNAFLTWGVFILTGINTIPPSLTEDLRTALTKFFDLPLDDKLKLHLKNGGWAWRGYMPWGGEATKGKTDQKEGFYGGQELNLLDEHPQKGLPTYGQNRFPDEEVPEMRRLVLEYIERVTKLGLVLSDALSNALGLEQNEIRSRYLEPEPIQLFRAFKYSERGDLGTHGIGEHLDFGFWTILSQNAPGLQVLSPFGEWVDVPFIKDSFIVNVGGDILDRLTSGRYVSPLHRVLPPSSNSDRLSIPFFFDPAWTAEMRPLPKGEDQHPKVTDPKILKRWEQRSTFNDLQGIWGQYLGVKVQKVFPDLVLPEFSAVSRASGRHLVEVLKQN